MVAKVTLWFIHMPSTTHSTDKKVTVVSDKNRVLSFIYVVLFSLVDIELSTFLTLFTKLYVGSQFGKKSNSVMWVGKFNLSMYSSSPYPHIVCSHPSFHKP